MARLTTFSLAPFPLLRLGPDVGGPCRAARWTLKLVGLMAVIREKSMLAPILTLQAHSALFCIDFPTHSNPFQEPQTTC